MTRSDTNRLASRWARAGALFGVRPARKTPDLERLLLDTARQCAGNSRLFIFAVTWLADYSGYIARHRLKHLATAELERQFQPVLGLIVDTAIRAGAVKELAIAVENCPAADEPGPLFDVDRASKALWEVLKTTATPESRKWGVWVQPVKLKRDAVRPTGWIVQQNPEFRDRAIRRGDLRCTIIETLGRDVPGGELPSESALARRCSANRTAVRRALDELEKEGCDLRNVPPENRRDTRLALAEAT